MNFENTSVTVFMYQDGTVCDPFDWDAYICATFVPGGLIVDYRYVVTMSSGPKGSTYPLMYEYGLDCVTVTEPINNIGDLRAALDMIVEV